MEQAKKDFNALNKQIAELKKVRAASSRGPPLSHLQQPRRQPQRAPNEQSFSVFGSLQTMALAQWTVLEWQRHGVVGQQRHE